MEQRASFLVRLWTQNREEPETICGEVIHVRTGQRRSFRGEAELIRILRTWFDLAEAGSPSIPQNDEEV